jgi:hypothetical protein
LLILPLKEDLTGELPPIDATGGLKSSMITILSFDMIDNILLFDFATNISGVLFLWICL